MNQIRQDAVCLVDALDFTDYSLNSALGAYDGRVYEVNKYGCLLMLITSLPLTLAVLNSSDALRLGEKEQYEYQRRQCVICQRTPTSCQSWVDAISFVIKMQLILLSLCHSSLFSILHSRLISSRLVIYLL